MKICYVRNATGPSRTYTTSLTAQSLRIYAEIARRAIVEGINKEGVQAARLKLIERALKELQ